MKRFFFGYTETMAETNAKNKRNRQQTQKIEQTDTDCEEWKNSKEERINFGISPFFFPFQIVHTIDRWGEYEGVDEAISGSEQHWRQKACHHQNKVANQLDSELETMQCTVDRVQKHRFEHQE